MLKRQAPLSGHFSGWWSSPPRATSKTTPAPLIVFGHLRVPGSTYPHFRQNAVEFIGAGNLTPPILSSVQRRHAAVSSTALALYSDILKSSEKIDPPGMVASVEALFFCGAAGRRSTRRQQGAQVLIGQPTSSFGNHGWLRCADGSSVVLSPDHPSCVLASTNALR